MRSLFVRYVDDDGEDEGHRIFISSASLMYGSNMCGLIASIGHERMSVAKVTHWSIVGGISDVMERVWRREMEVKIRTTWHFRF